MSKKAKRRALFAAKRHVAFWAALERKHGPVYMGDPGDSPEIEHLLIKRGKVRNIYAVPRG